MPKKSNIYDASQTRFQIGTYIDEINSILKTNEEVEKFGGLITAIYRVSGLTDAYYQYDENGEYKIIEKKELKDMQDSYHDAIGQCVLAINGTKTDPTELKVKLIAQEILPFLVNDLVALNEVAEEGKGYTFPEIIHRANSKVIVHTENDAKINASVDLKLVSINLENVKPVGDMMNQRYPLSYKVGDKVQPGFFTMPQLQSVSARIKNTIDSFSKENPEYSTDLERIKDYYAFDENYIRNNPDDVLSTELDELPWVEMGFDEARVEELKKDDNFIELWENVSRAVAKDMSKVSFYDIDGVKSGQRIELRNVAMSQVGDALGVPKLLARSMTAQIMSKDKIYDGVFMETADGEDISHVQDGEGMALITAKQAREAYNDPRGLKSLANLQILDYICMNQDRHEKNMMYQFEDLNTDHPKFIGVQGIDNDLSFGTNVPDPDKKLQFLPAINDMQVISREMAEKVQKPETFAEIEAALKKNDLPQEEIEAARKRLENIITAIKEGRLRIVDDNEWGKGDNTFEKLAKKGESSLFNMVKTSVVDPMAERAEAWNALPEEERKVKPSKKLRYAMSVQVDSFGLGVADQREIKNLRAQVEKNFIKEVAEDISQMEMSDSLSEKDVLSYVREFSIGLYQILNDADPTFHGTSGTYKKLKTAAKELKSLSSRLSKKLKKDDDKLSAKDAKKLLDALAKMKKCSINYQNKKNNEKNEGRELSETGKKRLEAADLCHQFSDNIIVNYKKTIYVQISDMSPMHMVQRTIKTRLQSIPKQSGEKLRDQVAELIYAKVIASGSMELKKSNSLRTALDPDSMKQEVEKIKKLPAFDRFREISDDELKILATENDGSVLMDTFYRETVKAKHTEQIENRKQANQANNQKKNDNVQKAPQP